MVAQGKFTKGSASYVDEFAEALAMRLADAIEAVSQDSEDLSVDGLENQLVNEVALSAPCEVSKCWAPGENHI